MNLIPDSLQEISATLKRNKLRTALTGFAVAWGVILLVVLLSSGEGFRSAMVKNMSSQGEGLKTITINPSRTTLAYKGYKKDRWVRISYEDVLRIVADYSEVVDDFSALIPLHRAPFSLTYQNKSTTQNGSVYGCRSSIVPTKLRLFAGRFINETDMRTARKVMVIERENAIELFGGVDAAVGQQLTWNGAHYTVVGVVNKISGGNYQQAYIPISTLQLIYHSNDARYVESITLLCNGFASAAEAKIFCDKLKQELNARYQVSPEDQGGIYVDNDLESSETTRQIFAGINLFLWLIGFSTLLIGLIGVANIMQITVVERSVEIGIRKALGAKPWAIIRMILRESVLVTLLAGCIGLAFGVGLMELVSYLLTHFNIGATTVDGSTLTIFRNPFIGFGTAVSILILMVLCGTLAGYLPARRAVRISAIEAMRK